MTYMDTMKIIKTLIIRFANPIRSKDIPFFRGAVIQSLEQKNILFHNHTENGFRYSYPLIQYKSLGGKAAIVCVDNGTEAIGEIFNNLQFSFTIKENTYKAEMEDIRAFQTTVECSDTLFHYTIKKWLPLNSTNYAIYSSTESIATHIDIFERVLIGNIISFLKGVDIHIDDKILLSITNIDNQRIVKYKGVSLMSFDIAFNSNFHLPNFIGLGKGTSIGFGVLQLKNKNQS